MRRILLLFLLLLSETAMASAPSTVLDDVVLDLARLPKHERVYYRYLTPWPLSEEVDVLEPVLMGWINHLTFRNVCYRPKRTQEGLYRIDLRAVGWDAKVWEALADADPYFAVSVTRTDGTINRGWLNPAAYLAATRETHSSLPVLRADFFIARTSLERGGKGFYRQGFYSDMMGLPKTEKELFEFVGAKTTLGKFFLVRGDGVEKSEVAIHNRGLELIPSLLGGDQRYLWRSLDTLSNLDDQDIYEALAGTLRADGKEFVLSLPNGLQFYYITDGAGNQVFEVPQNVAQDRKAAADVTVLSPRSCVTCHPKGVRHFEGRVRSLALSPNARLQVFRDKKKDQKGLREKLEDYYLSDLGRTITKHQESYSEAILECSGLEATKFAEQYRQVLDTYFYGEVDRETAIRETGFSEDVIDGYLARAGHSTFVRIREGRSVTRENWEHVYHRLMQAAVYPWEEKP